MSPDADVQSCACCSRVKLCLWTFNIPPGGQLPWGYAWICGDCAE